MQLASGGMSHKTNTFASLPITLADFTRDSGGDPAFTPQFSVTQHAGTATIPGGSLEAAAQPGMELVPFLPAAATPGGTLQESVY